MTWGSAAVEPTAGWCTRARCSGAPPAAAGAHGGLTWSQITGTRADQLRVRESVEGDSVVAEAEEVKGTQRPLRATGPRVVAAVGCVRRLDRVPARSETGDAVSKSKSGEMAGAFEEVERDHGGVRERCPLAIATLSIRTYAAPQKPLTHSAPVRPNWFVEIEIVYWSSRGSAGRRGRGRAQPPSPPKCPD